MKKQLNCLVLNPAFSVAGMQKNTVISIPCGAVRHPVVLTAQQHFYVDYILHNSEGAINLNRVIPTTEEAVQARTDCLEVMYFTTLFWDLTENTVQNATTSLTAVTAENGASEAPEAPEQEEYQEEQQDDQDDINWNDMTTLASMGPADAFYNYIEKGLHYSNKAEFETCIKKICKQSHSKKITGEQYKNTAGNVKKQFNSKKMNLQTFQELIKLLTGIEIEVQLLLHQHKLLLHQHKLLLHQHKLLLQHHVSGMSRELTLRKKLMLSIPGTPIVSQIEQWTKVNYHSVFMEHPEWRVERYSSSMVRIYACTLQEEHMQAFGRALMQGKDFGEYKVVDHE
eukprot:m51a1_g5906 hypothetical protein (340) ;mRNA; f:583944-602384